MTSSPRLLRQEEALQFVESIEQPMLRRVVGVFCRRVLNRFSRKKRLPVTDFDFLYFAEGIARFCGDGRTISAIFDGEDIRWDDDDQRNADCCPLPDRPPGELVDPKIKWTARLHEADWFADAIQDLALHQLVFMATFAIWRAPTPFHFDDEPPTSRRYPDAPIDLLFCAEIIFELCQLKQRIGRTLLVQAD